MKFNYKKYGQDTFRPVIDIGLANGKNKLEYAYGALVDSGADMCLFNTEVGEAIGIDIKKGKPREVMGVGGKVSVYYLHPVKINVGGWEYEMEAGFMPDVGGRIVPYGIVGQRGFFEHFIVKFDFKKKEIELKNRN